METGCGPGPGLLSPLLLSVLGQNFKEAMNSKLKPGLPGFTFVKLGKKVIFYLSVFGSVYTFKMETYGIWAIHVTLTIGAHGFAMNLEVNVNSIFSLVWP